MTKSQNNINNCTNCGLCRKKCPIFRVTLNETNSPRGKSILIKNEILDDYLLRCTGCGNCELVCPHNIKFDFKKYKSKLIKSGKESNKDKKMISNIRKHGNPFGKLDKDKKSDELYCC